MGLLPVLLLHFIMFTLLVVALIDSHAVNWAVVDGDGDGERNEAATYLYV